MSEIAAANVTNLTTHFLLDRRTVLPPVGTVSLHVIRTYPEEGDTCTCTKALPSHGGRLLLHVRLTHKKCSMGTAKPCLVPCRTAYHLCGPGGSSVRDVSCGSSQCRIKVARGPWHIIIRGAPSPRTCNICHFNGCKRTSEGKR